jgi:outer membrane scaffolding protein for murein synthesis (MipA/OmpV family)
MKFRFLLLLAGAAPAVHAQTNAIMPEGSHDTYIGALATIGPRAEGSSRQSVLVVPNFSVAWSNGAFLQGTRAGFDLSGDRTLHYGPLFGFARRAPRADAPGSRGSWGVDPGAFVSYALAHNISLNSSLEYGEANGTGLLLRLGASYGVPLSAHQSLQLSTGVNLADHRYMQSYFSTRNYDAQGGLKNAYLGANWSVQLNNKYRLLSGVHLTRLADKAGLSPIVEQRNGVRLTTALSYHY